MGDEKATDEPVADAVVVRRVIDDKGDVQVLTSTQGDIRVTEIGDILAYALSLHRAKLGLD